MKSSPKNKKVVAVSGGFDPVHPGHINYFREAKKLGDELVVIINNDHWIHSKKGHGFMSAKDRALVIAAFRHVDRVIISKHKKNTKDMSVSKEILALKPDIFANGGDRNEKDAKNPKSSLYKDVEMCKRLGVKMVFNTGHDKKMLSSSKLLKQYLKKYSRGKK